MSAKRLSEKDLAGALDKRVGIRISRTDLLNEALTHASAREASGADYQRLEFLGDRVLGLVIAEMLYKAFPDAPEGELSVRLNALVNGDTLAEVARELKLDGLVNIGSEMRAIAPRKRVNLLADIMEALIAVIYLEHGLEQAREFIHAHWIERSREPAAARQDAKTALQEWAHQAAGNTPRYAVVSREGPDHEPVFTVEVTIEGFPGGHGTGRSKREAEQAAASFVLEREGVWQKQAHSS